MNEIKMEKPVQRDVGVGHITFMALEVGAQWPSGLEPRGENAPDAVVIAQQVGEAHSEFADRVKHKLSSLLEHHRAVRTAVLATARSFDFSALESRCALAHALLRALDDAPEAELVLTSTDNPAPENRAHLFALAGALGESVNYGIGIRV